MFNPYLDEFKNYLESFDLDLEYWMNFETRELSFEKLPKLLEKSFDFRRTAVVKYSWSIPNEEAISEIVKYSPIIEIGAGNGYWANLIEQAGGSIKPTDIKPWENLWTKVEPLSECDAVQKYNEINTLMTCWPPYNSPMAHNALLEFKGDTVVYIGEYEGCTADHSFHSLLEKDFFSHKIIDIPKYYGIHDCLMVFKRKVGLQALETDV